MMSHLNKNRISLIAFTGKKGSGKSKATECLVKQKEAVCVRFSESLKHGIEVCLNIPHDQLYCPVKKDNPFPTPMRITKEDADKLLTYFIGSTSPSIANYISSKTFNTPRQLLQFVGTNVIRDLIDPEFWIKQFKNKVSELVKDSTLVVCDDVRFPNEVEAIKELSGIVVEIKRPSTNTSDTHESENSISETFATTFTNDFEGVAPLERSILLWYDSFINSGVTAEDYWKNCSKK
jgi:hypothetical protein